MKSKHIFLIFILSVVGVLAYCCIKFSMMFRPLGDRGAVYETFETANNTFKVRVAALYEENVCMPGAYLVYESAPIDSNQWREFLAYRTDDAIPIPRERFRFLNEQTAYVCLWYDFAVTLDGGRAWKFGSHFFRSRTVSFCIGQSQRRVSKLTEQVKLRSKVTTNRRKLEFRLKFTRKNLGRVGA